MTSSNEAAADRPPIGRPPLPERRTPSESTQRAKICRASTFSDASPNAVATTLTQQFEALLEERGSRRVSRLARSFSFDMSPDEVDTSHIEGIKRREDSIRSLAVASDEECDLAPPQKPQRTDGGYSAEEIALRRFMSLIAWGSGLPVLKHNRGRGKVRRVLRFNDQVGLLTSDTDPKNSGTTYYHKYLWRYICDTVGLLESAPFHVFLLTRYSTRSDEWNVAMLQRS